MSEIIFYLSPPFFFFFFYSDSFVIITKNSLSLSTVDSAIAMHIVYIGYLSTNFIISAAKQFCNISACNMCAVAVCCLAPVCILIYSDRVCF